MHKNNYFSTSIIVVENFFAETYLKKKTKVFNKNKNVLYSIFLNLVLFAAKFIQVKFHPK